MVKYWTTEQLDIGDMMLGERLIIERKTFSDLKNSVFDGRYKEQKMRLMSMKNKGYEVMYIIEGDMPEFEEKLLHGCIISTILRDKLLLYRTLNIQETFNFLVHLTERFLKKIPLPETSGGSKNEEYIYNKTKKKNITQETCFINQLLCIPGIGPKTARKLCDKYEILEKFVSSVKKSEKKLRKYSKYLFKK